MKEIELKFQIPPAQRGAVRDRIEAIARAGAQAAHTLPLHAAYFDTPDHALARHKCALRVRREGDDWVQTYKGAGADAMTRLEENIEVPAPADGQPRPDLARHSAPVQTGLARALNWNVSADPHGHQLGLRPLYETRFQRLHTQQFHGTTGAVHVCLDEGEIVAGALSQPLAELELELVAGAPQALIDLAHGWVAQHGLWLDVQSKAMKGTRLAQAAATGEPIQAQALHLPSDWQASFAMEEPQAEGQVPASWRGGLSKALDVAAGNWAELALGHPGWPLALSAWARAHDALGTLMVQRPDVAAWLGEPFTEQHQQLQGLLGASAPSQAVASSPLPTTWALLLLSRLNAV